MKSYLGKLDKNSFLNSDTSVTTWSTINDQNVVDTIKDKLIFISKECY